MFKIQKYFGFLTKCHILFFSQNAILHKSINAHLTTTLRIYGWWLCQLPSKSLLCAGIEFDVCIKSITWLKYGRYGLKLYFINQSFKSIDNNQLVPLRLIHIFNIFGLEYVSNRCLFKWYFCVYFSPLHMNITILSIFNIYFEFLYPLNEKRKIVWRLGTKRIIIQESWNKSKQHRYHINIFTFLWSRRTFKKNY